MVLPEISLTSGIIAWITALITIAVGLAVKDLLTTSVNGVLFFFNSDFRVGDRVYINGQKAIIIRIGFRQTIFRIDRDDEEIWLFVFNDRIKYQSLEKIII